MNGPHDSGFCRAIAGIGSPVTVYAHGQAALTIVRDAGETLICTQDPSHAGSHASCDGQGRILARWPRRTVERYWQHGDCDGCDHEHPGVAS